MYKRQDQEWLDRLRPTEVGGEASLRFRSPLLARAIAETVTDSDRQTGEELRRRLGPTGTTDPTSE